MEKLYPIIKRAKTCLGNKIEPEDSYYKLYYCPTCNGRLSGKNVDPKLWDATKKCKNGEPVYCKYCGSLIYPLETI